MLLEIFASHSMVPLEFNPANSGDDHLLYHLAKQEQEAERKGGALQALSDYYCRIFKAAMPPLVARRRHALHRSKQAI